MTEILARGPNFVYAKDFVLSTCGADVWNRVLARMPADAAAVWRENVLAIESHPFAMFKAIVPALAGETRESCQVENSAMYEHIADRSLNLLYKLFFSFTNPSFVLGNYPLLWKRFFTAGKVEVPLAEHEHATIVFELPEIFLDWLPSACFGYSKKAVEMAGGKNLRMEETDRRKLPSGEWRVTFDLRWSERAA